MSKVLELCERIEGEEWKTVRGYPSYAISNKGRVFGLRFKKLLKLNITRKGYQRVGLYNKKGCKGRSVHGLVLEHFLSKRPNGKVACHNNGNKLDNRIENLRWDSQLNNIRDSIRMGTQVNGERQRSAKLNADAIKYIKENWKVNPNCKRKSNSVALGKMFGVTDKTVMQVIRGITWKHLLKP